MNNDQFNMLFTYLDQRFDAVDAGLAAVKGGISEILNTLDGMAGDLDNIRTELLSIDSQLIRHEQLLAQLADHMGVRLRHSPEVASPRDRSCLKANAANDSTGSRKPG